MLMLTNITHTKDFPTLPILTTEQHPADSPRALESYFVIFPLFDKNLFLRRR